MGHQCQENRGRQAANRKSWVGTVQGVGLKAYEDRFKRPITIESFWACRGHTGVMVDTAETNHQKTRV